MSPVAVCRPTTRTCCAAPDCLTGWKGCKEFTHTNVSVLPGAAEWVLLEPPLIAVYCRESVTCRNRQQENDPRTLESPPSGKRSMRRHHEELAVGPAILPALSLLLPVAAAWWLRILTGRKNDKKSRSALAESEGDV
jgi:hypothetical protein